MSSLAPLAPVPTIAPARALAPLAPTAPTAQLAPAVFAAPAAPAPGQAKVGAQLLFDFPGIQTGDTFKLGKGSKVAFAGIKGEATILALEPNQAQFRIQGKALFLSVDASVGITLLDNGVVKLHAEGKGVPTLDANGRIAEQRTNFLRIAPTEMRVKDTTIQRTGEDTILIDFEHPQMGNTHLVLERVKNAAPAAPRSKS